MMTQHLAPTTSVVMLDRPFADEILMCVSRSFSLFPERIPEMVEAGLDMRLRLELWLAGRREGRGRETK